MFPAGAAPRLRGLATPHHAAVTRLSAAPRVQSAHARRPGGADLTACARCSSKAAASDASVDSVQWSMLIRPSPKDRDRSLPNSASAPNSAAIHSASSTHFSEHLHAWRPRDKDRKDAGKFDNATAATSARAVSIHHSLDEPPASGPSSASWLDHAPLRTMSCADLFGVMPLVPLRHFHLCTGRRSFITSAFDEKSGRRGADGRRVTLLGKQAPACGNMSCCLATCCASAGSKRAGCGCGEHCAGDTASVGLWLRVQRTSNRTS